VRGARPGALGYLDVHDLCGSISAATGDPVKVVDVVLWRYAEMPKVPGNFPVVSEDK
jgi:hypothetical protein